MSVRFLRVTAAVLLVVTLLAGCTSTTGAQSTNTMDLTPGGTVFPLPSVPISPGNSSATRPVDTASKSVSQVTATSSKTSPRVPPTKPTTAPRSSSKATVTPKTTPAPTVNTTGLSAQEVKDRQAVEVAWLDYWTVTFGLMKVPGAERRQDLSRVAVDPILSDVLETATQFQTDGVDNYGYVRHKFYWIQSVDGKDASTVGDCMDTSHGGSMNVKTQEKLTVGHKNDNAKISFQRGPDHHWRVSDIQFIHVKC